MPFRFSRHKLLSRGSLAAPLVLLAALASACERAVTLLTPEGLRPRATVSSISSLSPDSAQVGDAYVELTVRGHSFTQDSWVVWDDAFQYTTFVNDSTLTVWLGDYAFQTAGTHEVKVYTGDDGYTDPLTFTVYNPRPTITRMTPDSVAKGTEVFEVVVEGTGFLDGTTARWNGEDRSTIVDGPTRLRMYLNWMDTRDYTLAEVTVWSPGPGGGASLPDTFMVAPSFFLHTHAARAGGGGFTLDVRGEGFEPGAVVYWNGSPRSTWRVSATELKAAIGAADVAAPGEGRVTVTSPGLGGSAWSAGTVAVRGVGPATVASQLTLELAVRDLVYLPATDRLYATVYAGPLANHLAVIDPHTGAVENAYWVGESPRYLAASGDGKEIWVGVDGENRVRRFVVAWAWLDYGIQLGDHVAEDIAVMPDSPHVVAVSRRNTCCSPRHEGVAIYSSYGSQRPTATASGAGSNVIEFGLTPGLLFGLDNETTGTRYRQMRVDEDGVTVTSGFGLNLTGYPDIAQAGGRIYTSEGPAVDPDMGDWAGFFSAKGAVRPDVETGRVYFLDTGGIKVADMNTFQTLATLPVPPLAFEHPANQRRHLVRWGADGLAWHDADEVFILRSPIVAP